MVDALLTALERVIQNEDALPTVRTLATRAGVAIGSIYYYIREREDLVSLLVMREERRIAERALDVLARTPVSTPTADIEAILRDLVAWRNERGWVSRLPVRFMKGHAWVESIFRSSVGTLAKPLEEVFRRHLVRPMTASDKLHLVGAAVGNQLAWVFAIDGAEDIDVLVRMIGGYIEALPKVDDAAP
ncbi:MAG: TetR/AcrR family transcriptional regulator [Polyangiaceae bacterium]